MDETPSASALTSPTTEENIHVRIDAWRDGAAAGLELHAYLGWTWKQYVAWVKAGTYPIAEPAPLAAAAPGAQEAVPAA